MKELDGKLRYDYLSGPVGVWTGPPAKTPQEARDAIADAVEDALGGEYGNFDWIRQLPIKETP